MEPSSELPRRAYAAFNACDVDAALAFLQPEIEPLAFRSDEAGRMIVLVHQVERDPAGTVLADRVVEPVYTMANATIWSMRMRDPGARE